MMKSQFCPNLWEVGRCATLNCRYPHTAFPCNICRLIFSSDDRLQKHNRQYHPLNGGPAQPSSYCQLCGKDVKGSIAAHKGTTPHLRRKETLSKKGILPRDLNNLSGDVVNCASCAMEVPAQLFNAHLMAASHRRKDRFTKYKNSLQEGKANKFGVSVHEERLDFGVIEPDILAARPVMESKFRLHADVNGFVLTEVRMASSFSAFTQTGFKARLSSPVALTVDLTYALSVKFDPQGNRGHYEDRVELVFEHPAQDTRFIIARPVEATVGIVRTNKP